jgi:hypothetical protein
VLAEVEAAVLLAAVLLADEEVVPMPPMPPVPAMLPELDVSPLELDVLLPPVPPAPPEPVTFALDEPPNRLVEVSELQPAATEAALTKAKPKILTTFMLTSRTTASGG